MFNYYPPSQKLRPFIQGYLDADFRNTSDKGEHTLFPNGYSGIFFNFGNPGKLIIKEEYKTPLVSVFGQIDRHFTIIHYPGFYSMGILLKPTILSWLLKLDMSSITNKAFEGQLINIQLKDLHEQMEATPFVEEKIKLFENFFLAELVKREYKNTIADHALNMLNHSGPVDVPAIARQLQVSQRHLEAQFKKTIGLSPKSYSIIMRFKRIEEQLKKSSLVSWREMPFASEYYDQNHFIKDFKRFTGLTPSTYLLENLEMGRSYLLRSSIR